MEADRAPHKCATAMGYMFVFPALVALRHKDPHAHRPYRASPAGSYRGHRTRRVVWSRIAASGRWHAGFSAGHGRAQFGP